MTSTDPCYFSNLLEVLSTSANVTIGNDTHTHTHTDTHTHTHTHLPLSHSPILGSRVGHVLTFIFCGARALVSRLACVAEGP